MNLCYVLSLRLDATRAGVEEVFREGREIVVRFRSDATIDPAALARELGPSVRARSRQVRMPLGRGTEWMPKLREVIDQALNSGLAPPRPSGARSGPSRG